MKTIQTIREKASSLLTMITMEVVQYTKAYTCAIRHQDMYPTQVTAMMKTHQLILLQRIFQMTALTRIVQEVIQLPLYVIALQCRIFRIFTIMIPGHLAGGAMCLVANPHHMTRC